MGIFGAGIGKVLGSELGKGVGSALGGIVGGKKGRELGGKLGGSVGSIGGGSLGVLAPFKNGGAVGKGKRKGTPVQILAHAGEFVLPANAKPTKAQKAIVAKNKRNAK